ncbi:MAG: sugar ABC transporter permease, partial [Lachnospiraceae bacterium]|nr:sugar ABC transporter permease [Lachnospiraceae bacterium]
MKKNSSEAVQYTSAKLKRLVMDIITHIFLTVLAIIWIAPVVWVIITSFRGEKGDFIDRIIPNSFTINNYKKLFTDTGTLNFPRMFMNTLIISVIV